MTTQQSIDETSRLKRIAQQDQTALSELYDRYAKVMYALALNVLESVEEAEEVVLDVFSQVWRTAERYDATRGRVDAWLFLLTRSRALERLRALQRLTQAATASVNAAIAQPSPGNPAEDSLIAERRAQVVAALNHLPEEQRQVLELAYYKGLTDAEIATQTGHSLGTVRTRIRLGLSKLRVTLGSVESDK